MDSNNNNNADHIDPASSQLLSSQYASLFKPRPNQDAKQLKGLRRENLKNLVTALDDADLLFLRSLSRQSFPHLPPEIRIMISRLLPLQDVLNCARVSHSWRSAVSNESIIKGLLAYHFPGATIPGDGTLWEFFHKKAMASVRRVEGRYISCLPVSMFDPVGSPFVLDPPGYDERLKTEDPSTRRNEMIRRKGGLKHRYLYNDGRFAWHIDENRVFVDDLRATPVTRTLVQPPGDHVLTDKFWLDIRLLTENLLVFLDRNHGRKVIVYHLQLKQFKEFTLPVTADGFFGQNETLAVLFSGHTPVFWRWSPGRLRKLMIPYEVDKLFHSSNPKILSFGVIFHPNDSSVLYLVFVSRVAPQPAGNLLPPASEGPADIIATSVHKFGNENYIQSFSLKTSYPTFCRHRSRYWPLNPANYNLGLFFPADQDLTFTDYFVSQINFNVLTETFSDGTHMLNTGMRRPLWDPSDFAADEDDSFSWREARFRGHAWNDQLYYLQMPSFKIATYGPRSHWRYSEEAHHCTADKSQTLVANWRKVITASAAAESSTTVIDHLVDDYFVIVVREDGYVAYNYDRKAPINEPWKRPDDQVTFHDGNTTCPVQGCGHVFCDKASKTK